MNLPPKRCPECDEEYVHSVMRCVHCDVPLILAGELGAETATELPPVSELRCLRAASVGWARGLSERLREVGIPHRIEAAADDDAEGARRPGRTLPYGVYVRDEDAEAAAEIDAQHMQAEIPDLPEGFEMSAEVSDACPACGHPVEATTSECGGCGLVLAVGE